MSPNPRKIASLGRSEVFWLGLLLAATGFLAFYRLESYPRFNFDEGYYLLIAKNFVTQGLYALSSTPGDVVWFGLGNSSPTLILPIAVSFEVFGVGMVAGRIVSALYLVGASVTTYVLMRHLYDWQTAAVAVALFLVSGSLIEYNTLLLGRRVLGEIPALFFIFLALRIWYRSWESGRLLDAAAAGLLFGLGFVTKEQFMPLVLLAGGLVWLADRFYYRQLKIVIFIVPLLVSAVPPGAWYLYKLSVLGVDAFRDHLGTLSAVSQASTWLFSPSTWSGNVALLYNHFFIFVGLPGILYTLGLSCRPTLAGLKTLFLPVFATLSVLWFVFVSIGWWRYGHPGMALAGLLAAKPIRDMVLGLSLRPSRLWSGLRQGAQARQVVAVIVAFLLIAYPLQNVSRQILFDTDRTPQEFASFVEQHTEPEALIESYVWEITFLTSRRFHHPPSDVFVLALEKRLDGAYNPLAHAPQYLIDGPYSKSVELYPTAWLDACCRKVVSVGAYDLYAVVVPVEP